MSELPIVAVSTNPLEAPKPEQTNRVQCGKTIAELAEQVARQHPGSLFSCTVNGRNLSRLTEAQRLHIAAIEAAGADASAEFAALVREAAGWEYVTQPGDIVVFHVRPGREAVRYLLYIAIIVASIYYPAAVPYLTAALTVYNVLVPPKTSQQKQDTPDSVYTTSLDGNVARLDQPIPRHFGRVKTTPPFAAQPYSEWRRKTPTGADLNRVQYYSAVFCLGIGPYEVERAFIGRTSLRHFQDVVVARYLPPGTLPTDVLANVVSSEEVAGGLDLPGLDGSGFSNYTTAVAAARPGDRVFKIGVDIGAPYGLGGGAGRTAEWQVEARSIDDYGSPIGEWTVLANESRTANTATPQYWSFEYTFSAPIRPEVRLARTDTQSTDPAYRDQIQWIALRAYLSNPAPLNPNASHYEVVLRASQQLTQQTSHQFSMILRALLPTWDPVTGWGDPVFTRNPAWALADLWSNPVWGEGLPDDRIDLAGIHAWSQTLEARQDRFDYSLVQTSAAWDFAQLVCRAGRARAFLRAGLVYSLARDEAVDLPVAAISPRIAQAGSMVLHAALPKRDRPDGYIVEYTSNVTWDTEQIECPCPGYTYTNTSDPRYDPALPQMSNPQYLTLEGITGAKHAEREGIYQAASLALRPFSCSSTIEMEGMLLAYLDAVRWQPEIPGYGQAGDVAFWDPATLVMGLSEPPDFTAGALYLTLVRDDTSLTVPVLVLPGPTAYDVTLPAAPDFPLVLDDGTRERPKFLLGPLTGGYEIAKISAITDGGKTDDDAQLYDIELLVDNPAVHTADNYLLPTLDEVQDPIDDGSDVDDGSSGGGHGVVLVRLRDHTIVGGNYTGLDPDHSGGKAEFRTFGNGSAGFFRQGRIPDDPGFDQAGTYPGEWLNTWPVESSVADDYEVYATDYGGGLAFLVTQGATLAGTFDTWLPGEVDHAWSLTADAAVQAALFGPGSVGGVLAVYVRRKSNGQVLVTKQVQLRVAYSGDDTGGGSGDD